MHTKACSHFARAFSFRPRVRLLGAPCAPAGRVWQQVLRSVWPWRQMGGHAGAVRVRGHREVARCSERREKCTGGGSGRPPEQFSPLFDLAMTTARGFQMSRGNHARSIWGRLRHFFGSRTIIKQMHCSAKAPERRLTSAPSEHSSTVGGRKVMYRYSALLDFDWYCTCVAFVLHWCCVAFVLMPRLCFACTLVRGIAVLHWKSWCCTPREFCMAPRFYLSCWYMFVTALLLCLSRASAVLY